MNESVDQARERINATLFERLSRLQAIRAAEPEERAKKWAALKIVYKSDPVAFVNDWGMTSDPRNAEIGLPVSVPFTLYPKQADFLRWLLTHWRGRQDGIVEKSRDEGATWLCVAFGVWMFLYYDETVVGFGSRKEEYVDNSKDNKSIFWKVRTFVGSLPRELRPASYSNTYMQTINNDNGASIVGEAGDNIGRGARASIYFKDESPFYEHPMQIDAALSQTSNCKIDVGTPNGFDNPFAQRRHSGTVDVFTFHWRDNPRKGPEWYAEQKRKLDPVILAQEVDIDYNASTSNAWIHGDLIAAAMGNGPRDVIAMGAWIVGVDAAHMGDDKSVLTARKGRLCIKFPALPAKLDGVALAGAVIAACRQIEAGIGERVAAIVIELDGPGVSAFDQMRTNPEWMDRVVGLHTGARLADGKNYNVRAELWQAARDWLMDTPASLPMDNDLKTQAGAMRYSYRDGVLLMESKKEYKKRVLRSPDDADSWVLTFLPSRLMPVVQQSFDIPSVVTAYNQRR